MSTGDTNCACQSAEQSIKQQAETWRNDPIWGGWSSYQGCDLDKEGTVKIPESEYRQFVAWKEFLLARKRFLDLIRLDVEKQMSNGPNKLPQDHIMSMQRPPFPPGMHPFNQQINFPQNPWMQPDFQRGRPGW